MRSELVGRERELAVLAECLDAALEGHPHVVLCLGEPGIGKTRLAEEVAGWAATRGAAAAWGRAVDSAGAPPYWPWRQVLRATSTTVDLAEIAHEHRLTASVAALAPDIFAASTEPVDRSASAEERFRLFDAVGTLLRQVSLRVPVVVVLDDIQWADHPTLLPCSISPAA